VSGQKRRGPKGALETLEEATHLLRIAPLRAHAAYYAGSVPFVLGFLYFWADMSRSPFARQNAAVEAFALAVLFIWMKCWHCVFTRTLLAFMRDEPFSAPSLPGAMRSVAVQAAIQPTGFIALPVAMLITLPFGWLYAFYQNVTVQGDTRGGLQAATRKSWQQAMLYPGQNHALMVMLLVCGLFVFLNVVIVMLLAPHALRALLGLETAWSRGGWRVFNTTFLTVACGMTYLALDPLVKCAYVLRCFYGESLQTGEDLKISLKNLRRRTGIAASVCAVLAAGLLAASVAGASAGETALVPGLREPGPVFSAADMDRSISRVIARPEYRWRMPRDWAPAEDGTGVLAAFCQSMKKTLAGWFRPVKEWLAKVLRWIGEKLSRLAPSGSQKTAKSAFPSPVLMYALLGLAASVFALLLRRALKGRKGSQALPAPPTAPAVPDVASEDVTADRLHPDGWLDLARQLMAEGKTRLALRALYLGTLAHLAQREMITLSSSKSNREYERELQRKTRDSRGLIPAFSDNVRLFERVWYGMYEVTDDILRRFHENQERVMRVAEEQ
jgi:hypothetical protein